MDISVVVIIYNPVLEKLYKTLDSVIVQKGINFEVIVCDDGSEYSANKELEEYFTDKQFSSFTLVFNDHNGTVSNFCSGLERAKGKYTKVISPGDYLINENILCRWVQYLEERGAEWSFADIYNYRLLDGKEQFIRMRAHPQNIRPYLKNQKDRCMWEYNARFDNVNGAATIGRTQVLLSYCERIKGKGIRYAEDFIYFLMTFDGVIGCYYPYAVICYEYGTGISTSGSIEWQEKLENDRTILYQIVREEENLSGLQKEILNVIARTRRIEKISIRGELGHWLRWHFHPRLTELPEEMDP